MIDIRHAEPGDFLSVIEMGAQLHRESPVFKSLRYSPIELHNFMVGLHENESGYAAIGYYDDEPDTPIAGMIGLREKSFFGPDLIAIDMGLFVPAEHRKSGVGAALIAHFTNWAKDSGAKLISVANNAGFDNGPFVAATERCGYTQAGSVMYRVEGD